VKVDIAREERDMLRRFGTLVIAAMIGAVLAGGASARSSGAVSPATQIDTLETHKVQHVIDVGTPGFGIGDVITVVSRLTTHEGATKLGVLHEVCTVVRTKELSLQCTSTAEFAGGAISATGEFPPGGPDDFEVITGGTGTYEGASGHVQTLPAPNHRLYVNYVLS
jgi:hypothetical protein